MNKQISTPAAIAIAVVVVLIAIALGWFFLGRAPAIHPISGTAGTSAVPGHGAAGNGQPAGKAQANI